MKLHPACSTASVLILAWLGPASAVSADQPVNASACPRPAAAPVYFLSSEIDMVALLAPPPAAESAAQREDLDGVLHAQKAAHDSGAVERAVADAVPDCGRIAEVLGAAARTDAAANAIALLTRAALEADTASAAPKHYWKRPRPYVLSAQVERLADVTPAKSGWAPSSAAPYSSGPRSMSLTAPIPVATQPSAPSAQSCWRTRCRKSARNCLRADANTAARG
jgi:hypothetical protein